MNTTQSTERPVNVSIKKDTKERLRQLGEKDDSYDDVIRNLLDVSAKGYEEQRNEAKKRRG